MYQYFTLVFDVVKLRKALRDSFVVITLLLTLIVNSVFAADQPSVVSTSRDSLSVKFVGVDGELLENIKRHVRLVHRLKSSEPLLDAELFRFKKSVFDEVKSALEPFGYYQAEVILETSLDGDALKYQVILNQAVRIDEVDIQLNQEALLQAEFAEWLKAFPLVSGQVLRQPDYELAKKTILSAALRLGYFDAQFLRSDIVIDQARTSADIALIFDSGQRYRIKNLDYQWRFDQSVGHQKGQIDASLLDAIVSVKAAEYFDTDDLSETQRRLLASPFFANVDVSPQDPDEDSGLVTIRIVLTPHKRRAYSVEVGAGTDTGLRGGLGYENRRINEQGHNLSLRLGASQIQRSLNLNYRMPLARGASDSLDFFASVDEENGDTRDFTNAQLGAELSLEWGESFIKYGLVASRERSFQLDDELVRQTRTTDLLIPSFGWQRTNSDDLYFPTKGWVGSITLRGASQSLGSDIDFAQAIVKGDALYPLTKGRLKLRFELANSLIDQASELPESLGFLAGGDDSIRGYRYESIGSIRNDEISVAKNLVVGSVEYQHPLVNDIALATFFDAGDAFDSEVDLKRGMGVGLRWRLPFGALRLDVASALDLEGKPWRLHFGFGTDL